MTSAGTRLAIETVVPDDEVALREWFDLERAVVSTDRPAAPPPCPQAHRVRLRSPYPGERCTAWLARAGATVVGVAELTLPTLDNLDNAWVELLVHPAHRRAGVGRALLERVASAARAEDRLRVAAEVSGAEDDPGSRFAAAAGATAALLETERRMPVPGDTAALARMQAAARAAASGYDLVQWTGPTPPRWRDDIAELTARMSTDAPLDDLHLEPERYDADRIAGRDAAHAARGHRTVVTAARHPDSDRLVAFTDIVVTASVDWHGDQGDTIVAPAHRGHRLGTWIKTANLDLARRERPRLTAIDTWNADSNPWMVAINEAMGFRPLHRWAEWELEL